MQTTSAARLTLLSITMLSAALVAAGCGVSGPGSTGATPSPDGRATTAPIGTPPSGTPVDGAVPAPILEAVITRTAAAAAVDPNSVTVVRAEPARWSDGSRGCPQPGVMYTQAIVDGYWIVLDAAGEEYDFRVSLDGDARRCEGLKPPGAGG
jgi:hypothetical protein